MLRLENVSLSYGRWPILDRVSLSLEKGQIGCLLGNSGCGKTSLLRAIAGLDPISAGEIYIGDQLVSDVRHSQAPERRGVGMEFQDGALFPHLNVIDNIHFGLTASAPDWIDQLVELTELTGILHRYPHELSGGQQQRVALARTLAPLPPVLLLDEPFANLDSALRGRLVERLRTVLTEKGVTTLIASHDQQEAFSITDYLGVMWKGHVLQWESPLTVYHQPADEYIARFVGEGCFLPGVVVDDTKVKMSLGVIGTDKPHGFAKDAQVKVLIRPDDIIHDDDSPMQARVVSKTYRGAEFMYTLSMVPEEQIQCLVPSHHNHAIDEMIGIRVEMDHLVVFPFRQATQETTD